MNVIAAAELAKHTTDTDAWVAVDGKIFDVSSFLSDHPGGKKVLLKECGKDATKKFNMFHDGGVLQKYGKDLQIGVLEGSPAAAAASSAPSTSSSSSSSSSSKGNNLYGDLIPFGDPAWYQGQFSPYYNESHRQWRDHIRAFVEKEIDPFVSEWEENYEIPKELFKKAGKAGLLSSSISSHWPAKYVNVKGPENFDMFHVLITTDELSRCGAGGVPWGLSGGLSIGLPPIYNFGSQYLKDKVVTDCLMGEKIICLCISEPWAASDVAGLKTTAERQGDHYVVNGCKKWITNGIYADYFTVACRTGTKGQGGLSLLLLERGMPGLKTRHMKCQGVWSSGTAFIEFDNVKVPVKNLIGKENEGFKYIMYNFNHERWSLAVQATRLARVCLEDAFRYSMRRMTFGKNLVEHQAIRMKLADMARMVESMQAWLESVTYQWIAMGHEKAMQTLGETVCLLKVQSTKVLELCAREALHTFGGAGYVRGGVGERVERIYRDVRAFAIPGGAEEILGDFAIRSSAKTARRRAKL